MNAQQNKIFSIFIYFMLLEPPQKHYFDQYSIMFILLGLSLDLENIVHTPEFVSSRRVAFYILNVFQVIKLDQTQNSVTIVLNNETFHELTIFNPINFRKTIKIMLFSIYLTGMK